MTNNKKIFTDVIKAPSWMAWVQRPGGLIKSGRKCKGFKREYID
jgi:hypothetical protein